MRHAPTQIGLLLAICVVAGNMVGSGIFLLPAVLASVGSGSLVAWALAALAAILLSVVYARLALLRRPTESIADYPRIALPHIIAYISWFAYWLACWVGTVAVLLATIGYLKALFGFDCGRVGDTCLLIICIWLIATANYFGPRFVGKLSAATLAIGLAPIAFVIALGLFKFDGQLFISAWNVTDVSIVKASAPLVLTIFWAFLGLESANAISQTVVNPKVNVPRAAILGTALAALIYALASAILFGLLPVEQLQISSAPFADAVSKAIGPIAGAVVALAALLRTFGCAAGWMLVSAEMSKSAVQSKYLPKWFAPDAAHQNRDIWVLAIMMTVVALATISSTLNAQFALIVDLSVLMFLGVYGVSSICLIIFAAKGSQPIRDRLLGVAGLIVSITVVIGYFVSF